MPGINMLLPGVSPSRKTEIPDPALTELSLAIMASVTFTIEECRCAHRTPSFSYDTLSS